MTLRAWAVLQRVTSTINPQLGGLKAALYGITRFDDESISDYVIRAQQLRTQITSTGQEFDDIELSRCILHGLDSDYSIIKTAGALNEEILENLDKVLDLLLAREHDVEREKEQMVNSLRMRSNAPIRTVNNTMNENMVNAPRTQNGRNGSGAQHDSSKDWLKGIECYKCHKFGHFARDCRSKQKFNITKGGQKGRNKKFWNKKGKKFNKKNNPKNTQAPQTPNLPPHLTQPQSK